MAKPTKKQQADYIKHLEDSAEKFRLTPEDLSNLTDLGMMIDWKTYEYVLKPNKMDKWFKKFIGRVDKITLVELEGLK